MERKKFRSRDFISYKLHFECRPHSHISMIHLSITLQGNILRPQWSYGKIVRNVVFINLQFVQWVNATLFVKYSSNLEKITISQFFQKTLNFDPPYLMKENILRANIIRKYICHKDKQMVKRRKKIVTQYSQVFFISARFFRGMTLKTLSLRPQNFFWKFHQQRPLATIFGLATKRAK